MKIFSALTLLGGTTIFIGVQAKVSFAALF
jgi:hypothetical protein